MEDGFFNPISISLFSVSGLLLIGSFCRCYFNKNNHNNKSLIITNEKSTQTDNNSFKIKINNPIVKKTFPQIKPYISFKKSKIMKYNP